MSTEAGANLVHTLHSDLESRTSISQHLTNCQLPSVGLGVVDLPQMWFQAVIRSSLDCDSHTSRFAQFRKSVRQLRVV